MGMKGVVRIVIRVFSQGVHQCKSDVVLVDICYTKQLICISLRVVSCQCNVKILGLEVEKVVLSFNTLFQGLSTHYLL